MKYYVKDENDYVIFGPTYNRALAEEIIEDSRQQGREDGLYIVETK